MGQWRIEGGNIWKERDFAANQEITMEVGLERDCTIRLQEDDLILPGLIDMHAHLWAPPARSPFGVEGNRYFSDGFVGALDAGTYGVNDWEEAEKYWQQFSNLRIKSFLSILPEGLTVFPPVTPTLPEEINTDCYVEVISAHPGQALGVKVQLGWLPYKSAETDEALMRLCREIADRSETHMMVHISGQCMNARDSANFLHKGDILTHPYSGFANTILDDRGNVLPEVFAARDRGVLFDMGYAGKHFSWRVFRQAYAQGLKFDTLGADLVEMSHRTPGSKVVDQFHILSALLNFGVSRQEVFQALVTNPAQYLGFPLSYHNQCVVLRRQEVDYEMVDGQVEGYTCSFLYVPVLVIQNGQLLKNHLQSK